MSTSHNWRFYLTKINEYNCVIICACACYVCACICVCVCAFDWLCLCVYACMYVDVRACMGGCFQIYMDLLQKIMFKLRYNQIWYMVKNNTYTNGSTVCIPHQSRTTKHVHLLPWIHLCVELFFWHHMFIVFLTLELKLWHSRILTRFCLRMSC